MWRIYEWQTFLSFQTACTDESCTMRPQTCDAKVNNVNFMMPWSLWSLERASSEHKNSPLGSGIRCDILAITSARLQRESLTAVWFQESSAYGWGKKLVKQKRLSHSLSYPYPQKHTHNIHAVTMQISANEMLMMFFNHRGRQWV